ncbi:HlyD family efflux transporter periplasmic adaptor subunit [Heliobacterium gestii]|uniref:HlyD family efflux transporter periplasmic adaptor subunit n=1 Tax=Heliomicrobium gestii TaxID=2699 RepID=A0A845LAW3_HELGE|nr:efflux RND transporter periplasmic adaptor subunit [Heliomicrobium gestii]MBM7867850.1 multidrug resistance efflux pump [Heliomicrobium gestii]MZP43338.1 HlyD family efflux transporter periplasmic adaptor subunit [Heliomicrobium gestii]
MKAKKLIVLIIGVYLVTTVLISAYYGYEHVYFVQTDDAKVAVDLNVARAPIGGRITDLKVRENDAVGKDEVLAVVEGSPAPNQPVQRTPVFVPSSGQVLRLDAREGEAVTAGQPLMAVADRADAYVLARFKEEESSRVQVGQTVDVTLDGAAGQVFPGIVSTINRNTEQITWPIISLTPARQQPKEDQLLNVKIQVPGAPLIPGTGASVKIRVKE